jgi:uncharacterized protein (TIGR02246 family)
MSEREIRELFLRQKEYWQARDANALTNCHTPDGVIVSPIFRTVVGADAIRKSYRALFDIFPDWDYQAQELLVSDNRACESFIVKATHVGNFFGISGTRKKVEIHGVRIFEMQHDLIAMDRRYYDFTAMLIQLGVLKSKPA